ncbi:MAG: NinE family protein [Raoultella sp.]|nr:NinE family protein [Raoultella sp.]
MSSQFAKVMDRGIFRVPARRRKCKAEVKPSDIPTLKDYTSRLVDKKWLRLRARRPHA